MPDLQLGSVPATGFAKQYKTLKNSVDAKIAYYVIKLHKYDCITNFRLKMA
jgi:hypothetical protein